MLSKIKDGFLFGFGAYLAVQVVQLLMLLAMALLAFLLQ